jgi:hypothetical protein
MVGLILLVAPSGKVNPVDSLSIDADAELNLEVSLTCVSFADGTICWKRIGRLKVPHNETTYTVVFCLK